jgi:hypothetical protein
MSYRLLIFGRLKDRAANLRRIDCVWPCQHTKILITSIPIKMYYHIYVPQTKFGRHIVFALFLLIIIILLLSFFLSFFLLPKVYPTHFSTTTEWKSMKLHRNLNLSTMSRCADYFLNFQNGHHCHGNGQNAKKLKNSKMR